MVPIRDKETETGQAVESNFYRAIRFYGAVVYVILLDLSRLYTLNSHDIVCTVRAIVCTDEECKLQRLCHKPVTELEGEGQSP